MYARVVVTLRKREGRCVEAVYVGWDGCRSLEAVPLPQLQRGQFLRGFLCRFLRPHFARGVIPLHKGFIDAL